MPSSIARVSFAESTGVLPVLTTCFGPRTELAGLKGRTWPTTSQSKEHPECGEVLFHARRREQGRELLDVGGDHHRLDLVERDPASFAPFREAAHGREVGKARVGVSDVCGEELPEAALGALGRVPPRSV